MLRRRTVLGIVSVFCSAIGIVLLLHLYGIRIDWNGNMSHVTIKNLASNDAKVEQSRAASGPSLRLLQRSRKQSSRR
jgi:hypothetical protein